MSAKIGLDKVAIACSICTDTRVEVTIATAIGYIKLVNCEIGHQSMSQDKVQINFTQEIEDELRRLKLCLLVSIDVDTDRMATIYPLDIEVLPMNADKILTLLKSLAHCSFERFVKILLSPLIRQWMIGEINDVEFMRVFRNLGGNGLPDVGGIHRTRG